MQIKKWISWFRRWFLRPLPIAWSYIAAGFFVIGLLFWGGFRAAMTLTDSIEFCTACHSMQTNYVEYKASTHYQNPMGVRAVCSDCHVPNDAWGYLVAKIKASQDLWGEIIGTIDTPEKFAARKLHLAEKVWASMEARDSKECRDCHSFEAMTIANQAENAQLQHPRAIQKGDTCISCHKGLVHSMPDLGPLAQVAFTKLEGTIGRVAADARTVHPIHTQDYFLDEAGEQKGGKILAGIPLRVEGIDGDKVKVRIDGWRQEDVDKVLYFDAGKRILVASLGEDARATITDTGAPVTLAETGQTWVPASLQGWLPAADLTADTDVLWEYARALFSVNCSVCHAIPHVNEYDANKWMGQLNAMVPSTNLAKEESRLLQTYLQLHASDSGAH